MKKELKEKARELRKEGWSYNEICRFLKISKSTTSLWCRDIELAPEQQKRLDDKRIASGKRSKNGSKFSQKCFELRNHSFQIGKELAQKYRSNPDFVAGCMLYSGEGTKNNNNDVVIANTDIRIVKSHKEFMKKYFGIEDKDFAVHFNFFIDKDITLEKVEKYWLDCLGLPKECLRKSTARAAKSIKNKYPNGVCYLAIYSTEIKMKIMGAIDELYKIILGE